MGTSTIPNTRTVVEQYYAYANEGAWDAWCDLFTEDQVMDEQLAGHVEGRETLRAMMAGFPATYTRFANVPRYVVVEGGQAAVVSHISALTKAGEGIEADVCNFFRVTADGLISYMSNFHDSVPFAPVLGK